MKTSFVGGKIDLWQAKYDITRLMDDKFRWVSNRRSQRPSYTWEGYYALVQHFALARPRIVGRPKSCLVAVRR